jgi:glucose-6-phosphate isomerase
MLELDFSNMMDKVIGSSGITGRQIDFMKAKISRIDRKIKSKRQSELSFVELLEQDTSEIKKIAVSVRNSFDNFIILGIGGSALGPKAIIEAMSPLHNIDRKPRIFICDNVDPRTLDRIFSVIDLNRTAVNVITKSGSTAETIASLMIFWEKMDKASVDKALRFIATTDPQKGNLRKIADENGLKSLSIPSGVGGRFSVLSPVGLLPAEVIGADSDEILRGARDIHKKCSEEEIFKNPAYLFGMLLYLMDKKKKRKINVIVPYADGLKSLGEWFCQIWAESLGKRGIGLTPYPSLGATDQHSQLQLWMEGPEDKVIIFIRVEDYAVDIQIPNVFNEIEGMSYLSGHTMSELIKAEQESTEIALSKIKRPSMTINIPKIDAYHMGQLFHFFQMATAFTGFLYGVNPFNQPGVEKGKDFTYGMMGRKGYESKKREVKNAKDIRYVV